MILGFLRQEKHRLAPDAIRLIKEADVFNILYRPLVSPFDQALRWFCRLTKRWENLLTLTELLRRLFQAEGVGYAVICFVFLFI